MATIKERFMIEITDEAYKQNSVYRPWDDTKASELTANTGTTVTQRPELNTLPAVKQRPAPARIPG